MTASTDIADNAIAQSSADTGLVRGYFLAQRDWEGRQRREFQQLRQALRGDVDAAREQAVALLWRLRNSYRVQFFLMMARQGFVEVLLKVLDDYGWLQEDPPSLFNASKTDVDNLAGFLPPVLYRHQTIIGRRDYSLLTKYLHFLYPESFPIYDSQVAVSIRMWAYFEFRQQGGLDGWERFSWKRLADSSGTGYADLLRFYIRFWSDASPEQRSRLVEVAAEIEETINGRVTVLDLIDKLLWQANGHPVRLGLLEPLR